MQEGANLTEIFESASRYLFYEARVKSFTDRWPHKSANLTPQKMAEAGFFYNPDNDNIDNVECPFCLKQLTGWEEQDDPLTEHRKRQDHCYFMRLGKREEEYTVEDFILLIAQRRAAIMGMIYKETLDMVEETVEKTVERITKLAKESVNTKRKANKCCKKIETS